MAAATVVVEAEVVFTAEAAASTAVGAAVFMVEVRMEAAFMAAAPMEAAAFMVERRGIFMVALAAHTVAVWDLEAIAAVAWGR